MLSMIEKPADKAPIITICGDAGTGKTSLAATFPNPVVIRAEDGLQAIPLTQRPDAFPVIGNAPQLWDQLGALLKEDHNYSTLIVDSVTALERLFIQHVIDNDPKKPSSINQAMGGYGAGLAAVASMHQRVRKAAGLLNEQKGMSVVFVAHADTEVMDLPDQDPYSRYSLRLAKKSLAPYVDDSDLVGFLRLEAFTKEKKVISTGERELITFANAANVSKNRYGITTPIKVEQGVNPLSKFIPCLQPKTKNQKED